ncbi:MAG: DNA replication/repair protein RecF [Gammaproteobacteria bacterium]|nr:DNA replication/repair protein RecF [Gammaproteobacteria bacterium]
MSFTGENGSGKTSLLEAVYFLGSGRTFRSQGADPLIRREADSCVAFGTVREENGREHRLGVQRGRNGSREIRIDGGSAQRTSDLARLLPTLVLGPHTVELVTGSPGVRRRFLNWGVFHVEPSFGELWEQYSRSLRQRNRLLKRSHVSSAELRSWNDALDRLASQVDAQRQAYFEAFSGPFSRTADALMGENQLDSRYYRGWESGRSLGETLLEQEASDRHRGFTQAGPHRADLRIRIAGQNAANVCSRGELKVLAWTLVLAQGASFRCRGSTLTYLVDDLASELDRRHRQRVCDLLDEGGNQVLVTGIERDQLELGWNAPKLFHVEHGQFHEQENDG